MSQDSPSQVDGARPRRRWQFSLRVVFVLMLILSVVFAAASYTPRYAAFAALMTPLALFPLVVASALRAIMARFGRFAVGQSQRQDDPPDEPLQQTLLRPLRFLGLYQPREDVSLASGLAVAVISTCTVVALWPVLREIGLQLAVATVRPPWQTWEFAIRSVNEEFSSGGYWLRLWRWELWAVGRWWVLFGGIAVLWLAGSSVVLRRRECKRWRQTSARLFAFAPWLIVLEMAFLIGVWIESPITVPEPSTGFVVGIFSWDLWHWDCWLDRDWLVRGAVPTLIAGCVFFKEVLRWPWPAAAAGAALLVPIALLLSVASTVAYFDGFPPLF